MFGYFGSGLRAQVSPLALCRSLFFFFKPQWGTAGQCWLKVSVSVVQCCSVLVGVGQCWSVLVNVVQCWSVLVSVVQCLIMGLIGGWFNLGMLLFGAFAPQK